MDQGTSNATQRPHINDDHIPTFCEATTEKTKDAEVADDIEVEIVKVVDPLKEDILADKAPEATDHLLTPRELPTPEDAVAKSVTKLTGPKDAMEIDSNDELDGFPMLVAHSHRSTKAKRGKQTQ